MGAFLIRKVGIKMLLKSSDTPTFHQKFFNFKTSSSLVISMPEEVLKM